MEGVQHYMCGWFTNGLTGECPAHVAMVDDRQVELHLDLTEDPIKDFLGQMMLLEYPTRHEGCVQMHVEDEGRVVLSFPA
ncbi:hypothetical protein EWM64_g3636 [Hericium alpestre]|uniref:Uncharacterized protein n=1 Tax=Hericium alpestre TaxID=135208 RepID=A0A4Z0A101_9AGAM|nr:hypothetical protein EWM64_g3636 [Hericium alpestre]